MIHSVMLRSYLLIAYRNLLRHKVFSVITIFGLAISMAAFLLILQYVYFEKSYDTFHQQSSYLYRIDRTAEKNGEKLSDGGLSYMLHGPSIKADIPEVADFARWHQAFGETIVTYGNQTFREQKVSFADPSFLQLFSFPLLKGDRNTVLKNPNSLILSQTMARKYFGEENPVGKILTLHDLRGKHLYTVTGIMEDIPANSHLSFDFLISIHEILQLDFYKKDPWVWSNFTTYVLLRPTADPAIVQARLTSLDKKYASKGMIQSGIEEKCLLKPLTQIYTHEHVNLYTHEASLSEAGKTIEYLSLIALFILGIGFINYINLSTARAVERAREVGIRKVVGASRLQLIKQFLLDATLVSSMAFVLALTTIQLSSPVYTSFVGKNIPAIWTNGIEFWGLILLVFCIGALLSGAYPAFSLSAFQPVTVLKGKFAHASKGILLRKSLVVFQFTMSVLLISSTVAVYRQINYMRNTDLGANISQTLVINAPTIVADHSTYTGKWEVFKNALQANTGIRSVTASNSIPGKGFNWTQEGIHREGANEESALVYSIAEIDTAYVPAYELEVVAGRNFDQLSGKRKVLLNETAVRNLGFASAAEAVGKYIFIPMISDKFEVIGVLKDYHHKSLQYKHDPIIYSYRPTTKQFYSLKLNTQHLPQTMAKLESAWNKIFPGNPFEAFFLDESFDQQYKADQQFGALIGFFSGLAILVACMGLFGLASFTITQRTKEIGVRKVIGASAGNIVIILSKDFVKLIALASLLAWPLTYYSISKWLEHYENRIELNLWLVFLPSLVVLGVALLSISIQTIKAARTNPVKALRYE